MKKENDPRATWKLPSYLPPKRRTASTDRRKDASRAKQADRREGDQRTLSSLLRL